LLSFYTQRNFVIVALLILLLPPPYLLANIAVVLTYVIVFHGIALKKSASFLALVMVIGYFYSILKAM